MGNGEWGIGNEEWGMGNGNGFKRQIQHIGGVYAMEISKQEQGMGVENGNWEQGSRNGKWEWGQA